MLYSNLALYLRTRGFVLLTLCFALSLVPVSHALDEGMWTFDNPPTEKLRAQYGFSPTSEWLEHVRLASVRINDGGSGSFVSPKGLVMTNQHVALGQIQKLSTAEANYVTSGFYAATTAEELRCPDLEINVLISTENVTARVRAAAKAESTRQKAADARRAEIARVEKESMERTGLRSNVVNLYHGGEYWLYRYKKYTDVRLVMAPESQAGFFGGDSDNFTYPRYCLDVAFLRVYEEGKPAHTRHFLKLNPTGPDNGELVFVVGNPGSTDRLFSYAQLEYQRDVRYSALLEYLDAFIELLQAYGRQGEEQNRHIQGLLLSYNNSKKALGGEHQGLLNIGLMESLNKREQSFRSDLRSLPNGKEYQEAFSTIARATDVAGESYHRRLYGVFHGSTLIQYASTIVRYATEIEKPDAERLPGFHDSQLDTVRFGLFSPAPLHADMEVALVQGFLEKSRRKLGKDDPFVRTVLAGQEPAAIVGPAFEKTTLVDVESRKALIEGGRAAVESSKDPLIAMVRRVDPILRKSEKWYRDEVESVLDAAGEQIAQARFALHGKSVYPDATFTLRLAFGTVKGYPMNGTRAPFQTTLYGLFDRSIGFERKGAWALPDRFWQNKSHLDLSTPVNFVSTVDITGGNSGSPVINTRGEAVGLIFDGNVESLVGRFAYEDVYGRSVSVHPAYILEALSKLYDAQALAAEIHGEGNGSR